VRKGLRLWANPLQHNRSVWPEHKKSQCNSLSLGVAALQLAVLLECCVVWYGAVEGEVEVVSGGEIRLNRNVFFGREVWSCQETWSKREPKL
jgi:hypothetical protein